VDPEDADTRHDADQAGAATTDGGPPAVGAFTQTDDAPPPDPDDLDRLRRG